MSDNGHRYFFGSWPEMPWKREEREEREMNILTKMHRTIEHPSLDEVRRKCRERAELKFKEFGYNIPKHYLDVVTLLMVDAYMGDVGKLHK